MALTRSTAEAITTVSYALQALVEAAQAVEAVHPASEREQYAKSSTGARQAQIALAEWAEGMRSSNLP